MVYQRKRRTVKRFFRKTNRKVAPSIKRFVKRAISRNIEHKYIDVSYSTATTTTPAFVLLNPLSQGTSSSTRIGERITMKSVQVKGWVSNGDALANRYVFMVVYDKQPNGALPASADIFTGNAYNGALRDPNWARRFKVLSHKFFDLSPLSLDDKGMRCINFYQKIHLPAHYQTNAGDITD